MAVVLCMSRMWIDGVKRRHCEVAEGQRGNPEAAL